jgi:Zn-dependent M16 (insulinase) family peptidase
LKSNDEWFSASELAGLNGMPVHPTNITRKAKSAGWVKKQVNGIKGVTFVYHIDSLPDETRQHLLVLRVNTSEDVIISEKAIQHVTLKSNDEWFSASELAGLNGMPVHPTNITRKAKLAGWVKKQVNGVKGVAFVYHIDSLPDETRQHLLVLRVNTSEDVILSEKAIQHVDDGSNNLSNGYES